MRSVGPAASVSRPPQGSPPELVPGRRCSKIVLRWLGGLTTQALRVTPWTFRASSPGRFENVRAEMAYYLAELDVDAVITDNPDQRPHEAA